MPIDIAVVVEDELSLAVVERVLSSSDRFQIILPLIERGFGNIKRSVPKYRNASHVLPHVVLTDLDNAPCPDQLRRAWQATDLPQAMMFRVAVREIEAWILADRQSFAKFAGIPIGKVPTTPEDLLDPKQTLINLVRRSRSRRLATELAPPVGSAVSIGPMYNERLCAFVRDSWRPEVASDCAPSLERMLSRLAIFLR